MELDLKDRHVFVAGASRGIGEGIARAFLDEGAKVTLTARGPESLNATQAALDAQYGKGRTFAFAGDMTATQPIEAALAAAEASFGPPSICIANVGLAAAAPGFEVTDAMWEDGIAQNFMGSMRLARAWLRRATAIPRERRGDANLVFISSIAGIEALGTVLTYGSMKAGLNHAAKELAKIAGREAIRVNTIAPGNIIFPGGSWEARVKERPEAWTRWINREVALRRFGTPEEIGRVAAFVASPRAAFVTGAVIPVDGGQVK
jgi:3-oxoacyl-[acyl-carrier protein] reductase